jgi:hypothetical protein
VGLVALVGLALLATRRSDATRQHWRALIAILAGGAIVWAIFYTSNLLFRFYGSQRDAYSALVAPALPLLIVLTPLAVFALRL